MKILIYGAGVVGCTYYPKLDVTLLYWCVKGKKKLYKRMAFKLSVLTLEGKQEKI